MQNCLVNRALSISQTPEFRDRPYLQWLLVRAALENRSTPPPHQAGEKKISTSPLSPFPVGSWNLWEHWAPTLGEIPASSIGYLLSSNCNWPLRSVLKYSTSITKWRPFKSLTVPRFPPLRLMLSQLRRRRNSPRVPSTLEMAQVTVLHACDEKYIWN